MPEHESYRVVVSKRAAQQLVEHAAFAARLDEKLAHKLVSGFRQAAVSLERFPFRNPVLVMIDPYVLISETLGILILVVITHRILKDSFCKIQSTVSVYAAAHQIIHPLVFCRRKIASSKIQFNIGVGFF